jgi:Recombinase
MVIGRRHQPKAGHAARKARTARADAWAAELRPIIESLQSAGVTSLQGIARTLNERGIRTPRGKGQWQASQVWRLLARLEEGAEITPGGPRGVPVDKYYVVVTQSHGALWEWEIYRNNEPLPVRLWDGPYKSARAAEAGGRVALREFLENLDRLDGG